MTHETPISIDLIELERDLIQTRASVDPAVAIRVLRAARAELAAAQRAERRSWLLTAAAVMLVGLHLSWWGAQRDWATHPAALDSAQVAACADRLRALVPELPQAEVERQARLALLAGGRYGPTAGSFTLPRPFGMQ